MPIFAFIFICLIAQLSAQDADKWAHRIQAHSNIHDMQSARMEAEQAYARLPESEVILAAYIRVLAVTGDEKEMLKIWQRYVSLFPEQALNRELIEDMAWGVLGKAAHSSSLIMRQMALLAALFSQDSKGVEIIFRGLQDSNYAIRAAAVSMAGHLHDAKLIDKIKQLFKTEKTWMVRQKIIKAIGSMDIKELRPDLEAIVASDQNLAEEKALAIESLVELMDQLERSDIIQLSGSNRAGLRLLACEAIAHFQSMRDLDRLLVLTTDFNANVRLAALQAIGLIRPQTDVQTIVNIARKGSQDSNYKVALSAVWLLTLYAPDEGMRLFSMHLASEKREQRLLAAGALKATGKYGSPLAMQLFDSHADPYVRLNLAIGLFGQRLAIPGVCRELERLMANEKDKWCKIKAGIFNSIVSSQFRKGEEDAEETPEMEDQLLRLEVLNTLAILKSQYALAAIRQFLIERTWGISGTAAALLLTEGDETAVDLVQQLLNDPQQKVRLQAALVLSLWSREEDAVQALEGGFEGSDQEQKCRILEGVGRIGSMKSVPFLIKVMEEPSQTLRLIAALALIQCLNH